MAAQLAGMQDTLTGLTRRLQILETSRVSAPCVATRHISDYFPVCQFEWRESVRLMCGVQAGGRDAGDGRLVRGELRPLQLPAPPLLLSSQ